MEPNKLQYDNKNWEKIILDVKDWLKNDIEPKSVRCADRFKNVNHPLVKTGHAFWISYDKLCIGYRLKGNFDIYKPIINNTLK